MAKTQKEIREVFACVVVDDLESSDAVVAYLIFSSEVDETSVSWLIRKFDLYKNDNCYTSEAWPSPVAGDETPTSKFVELKEVVSIDEGKEPDHSKPIVLSKGSLDPDLNSSIMRRLKRDCLAGFDTDCLADIDVDCLAED